MFRYVSMGRERIVDVRFLRALLGLVCAVLSCAGFGAGTAHAAHIHSIAINESNGASQSYKGGLRMAREQGPNLGSLQMALACVNRRVPPPFPVLPDSGDGAPGLSAPDVAPAALDVGDSRVAVTCQAAIGDFSADSPFALGAGALTFTVDGPGLIVESGSSTYTVDCGGSDGTCVGGVLLGPGSGGAVGPDALRFHVALQPGAALGAADFEAGITVSARFEGVEGETAGASGSVAVTRPAYRVQLASDHDVIADPSDRSAVVTARLVHVAHLECSPVGSGPFTVCDASGAELVLPGAEPGAVTFSTTFGVFPNGQRSIDAPCGLRPSEEALPEPDHERGFPLSCTTAAVRFNALDRAGDAVITATYTGGYTGATAGASLSVTVAPGPALIPLSPGCTAVSLPKAFPADAPLSLVAETVAPSDAVVSIWIEQAEGWLLGYARDSVAPLDVPVANPGDRVTICVGSDARFPLA
jgi:hypothetical protein